MSVLSPAASSSLHEGCGAGWRAEPPWTGAQPAAPTRRSSPIARGTPTPLTFQRPAAGGQQQRRQQQPSEQRQKPRRRAGSGHSPGRSGGRAGPRRRGWGRPRRRLGHSPRDPRQGGGAKQTGGSVTEVSPNPALRGDAGRSVPRESGRTGPGGSGALRDSTPEDSGGRGRGWSRFSGYSPRRAGLGSRAPGARAVRGRSRDLAAPLTYSLLLVLALERPLWARGAGLPACPSTLRPRPQRPTAHSQTAQPVGSAARAPLLEFSWPLFHRAHPRRLGAWSGRS